MPDDGEKEKDENYFTKYIDRRGIYVYDIARKEEWL